MILFQSEFVMTMSVTFYRIDHSKKSHDIVTDQAMVAKISRSMYCSHQSFSVSPLVITIEFVRLTWILFQSDFFMTLTVAFCSPDYGANRDRILGHFCVKFQVLSLIWSSSRHKVSLLAYSLVQHSTRLNYSLFPSYAFIAFRRHLVTGISQISHITTKMCFINRWFFVNEVC